MKLLLRLSSETRSRLSLPRATPSALPLPLQSVRGRVTSWVIKASLYMKTLFINLILYRLCSLAEPPKTARCVISIFLWNNTSLATQPASMCHWSLPTSLLHLQMLTKLNRFSHLFAVRSTKTRLTLRFRMGQLLKQTLRAAQSLTLNLLSSVSHRFIPCRMRP